MQATQGTSDVSYTVMGDTGNATGAYTGELPSLAAALEAVAGMDYPLCGFNPETGAVSIWMHRTGAVHDVLAGYKLDSGVVIVNQQIAWPRGKHTSWVSQGSVFGDVAGIPAEWVDYCRKLLAARVPGAQSHHGDHRRVFVNG